MAATHEPRTPAWPPRSAPRLFVTQAIIAGQAIVLEGNQAHYLNRVMRADAGSTVILCDDISGEWACTIEDIDKRHLTLRPVSRLRAREVVPDFWLCPALLKKDRFDMVLEKATELGVAQIRPVLTRRCVADKLNADRARTIVTEAAEQCARTALPLVSAPVPLGAMLADWPADRALFFADETGGEQATSAFANGRKAALLVGPEGGFDMTEREAVRAHPQARAITLGPRILRGETAAIAATAVWMALAGDWQNSLARTQQVS